MDKLLYQDKTVFNSHDGHLKLGTQHSLFSYVVTYISDSIGRDAIFKNINGDIYKVDMGASVSEGGILFTNDHRVEIKSSSGITYRLAENSEFSIERTVAGVVPVYYGKVYISGYTPNKFIDGGKYRTSCYNSTTRPLDLVIMNYSENVDIYYSLEYEAEVHEYDEKGERFNLFFSDKFTETKLETVAHKSMRDKYKVLCKRIMTNSEIERIYDYFVNPINWR